MKLNKRFITGISGGVLAVGIIVIISATGVKKKEAAQHESDAKMAQKNAARPVRYEKVKACRLAKQRSFPGTVKASEESALSFRVGGPLTVVNVKLGEPVKKGDLLMQIDPRDFEDRIQSLEAQLTGTEAMRQNAVQDYERIAKLFEEKVVPQADFDRARSAMDAAESAFKNLNVQLQIARHALEDTSLRAPYDGIVTEQKAENYEMIDSGKVVLRFHDIQTLEIAVNIPENEITNSLGESGVVHVSFPSVRGQVFEARLKEWSTQADPLTRTYSTTFELEAPNGVRILPGMTASVEILNTADKSLVLTVPISALVSGGANGTAVWVYDEVGGHAQLRSVTTGNLSGSSRVVIMEGLSEGERVVITGSRLIHENLSLKTTAVR